MDANRNKLNLGCGKITKPSTEGWWNVDKFTMPNVDQTIDLFRYPWDLPDNQFEEVFASHIIEHVPHEPKKYYSPSIDLQNLEAAKTPQDLIDVLQASNDKNAQFKVRWNELASLDGFFAFFAEVYRVCKPDAIVNIVCPFGYTRGAFQDPTHTRYIVPATFFYLQSQENGNWDYHLPLKFSPASFTFSAEKGVMESFKTQDEWEWAIGHEWDIATDLVVQMTVLK